MDEGDGVLSFENVNMKYPCGAASHQVLTGVSFTLTRGEVAAVIGDRFGGKTTMLRLAAGMEKPRSGTVRFLTSDLATLSERERVGLVGSAISWCDRHGPGMRLDVLDWVAMPLWVGRRRDRRHASERAQAALSIMGVPSVKNRTWSELSMWERVQVPLARGIVNEPSLLLVDDLLDGLGMLRTQEAAGLLRQIAEEIGCAVLVTVSDEEAAVLADRVLSLQGGRLRELARVEPSPPGKLVVFPGRIQGHRRAR